MRSLLTLAPFPDPSSSPWPSLLLRASKSSKWRDIRRGEDQGRRALLPYASEKLEHPVGNNSAGIRLQPHIQLRNNLFQLPRQGSGCLQAPSVCPKGGNKSTISPGGQQPSGDSAGPALQPCSLPAQRGAEGAGCCLSASATGRVPPRRPRPRPWEWSWSSAPRGGLTPSRQQCLTPSVLAGSAPQSRWLPRCWLHHLQDCPHSAPAAATSPSMPAPGVWTSWGVRRAKAQLVRRLCPFTPHRSPGEQPSLLWSGLGLSRPPACQELSSHFHSPDPHQRRLNIELFFAA